MECTRARIKPESKYCNSKKVKTLFKEYILFSDQEIQQTLETMNEKIGKRLDSLEDTMAQQNTTGECPMETTGSFLNPADNCSHILHHHPHATSGITVFIVHQNKILINSCVHRLLLAAELPWLCNEGVL